MNSLHLNYNHLPTRRPDLMKYIFFYFTLVLFSLKGLAQQEKSDSLINKVANYAYNDSTRVNLLIEVASSMKHTEPRTALPYIQEAISIAQKIDWQEGLGQAYVQKGNLYYIMADNLSALATYQKALSVFQNLDDIEGEASVLSNLGNIHADLKEYDKALEKYIAFLQKSEELNQKSNQVKALTNIAIVYTDTGRHIEGVAYLKKALSLAEEEENVFFQAAITNNLGLAYKGTKDYSKSLEYYRKAVQMAKEIKNDYIEASALNSIGKVSILLGDYKQAGISGKKALALSQRLGTTEWEADSWQVLSAVYEQQGKANKALEAYKNHIKFRDSVLGEEKKAEIARKEMQFELEKQEADSKLAIAEQTKAKNMYLLGGILLAFAGILGYFLYKRKRDRRERGKIEDFKAKVTETELKALRSQMNPHFIFNALNSISDYMDKNDVEKANGYLMKFAKLTRAILENSEKKWITLQEDLELMELYIEIEALRLKNKLFHHIEVDDDIDVENTLVPPLMLQPFIENSIWHGIAKKKGRGTIDIQIKKDEDVIICTVDDNGVGREMAVVNGAKHDSMGIKITKSRLDIINQLKQVKGSIDIIDKIEGLHVELKLPLELRF